MKARHYNLKKLVVLGSASVFTMLAVPLMSDIAFDHSTVLVSAAQAADDHDAIASLEEDTVGDVIATTDSGLDDTRQPGVVLVDDRVEVPAEIDAADIGRVDGDGSVGVGLAGAAAGEDTGREVEVPAARGVAGVRRGRIVAADVVGDAHRGAGRSIRAQQGQEQRLPALRAETGPRVRRRKGRYEGRSLGL